MTRRARRSWGRETFIHVVHNISLRLELTVIAFELFDHFSNSVKLLSMGRVIRQEGALIENNVNFQQHSQVMSESAVLSTWPSVTLLAENVRCEVQSRDAIYVHGHELRAVRKQSSSVVCADKQIKCTYVGVGRHYMYN